MIMPVSSHLSSPLKSTASVRQQGGAAAVVLSFLAIMLIALAALGWWWLSKPLPLRDNQPVDYAVEQGATARTIARGWVDAGVEAPDWLLYQWFRWSGQARQIRAGSYELEPGGSARDLLRMMVRGDERLSTVRLIEGWTFAQWRAELARAESLRATTAGLSAEEIMVQLGRPGVPAEGRFFPDTYAYAKGSTDLAVMRRALQAMDQRLAQAWAQRAANVPLRSMDEALILASIVEKETGMEADRTLVAGVFANRLRIGMRLQTDPTVIYGLGERFDGNLRKIDLQTDTPFNTYTRAGLPPTPISMPGKASLLAAVQPADTRALYFVARGDGSSVFSQTLDEHNRAVNRYQRQQASRAP